tara:strand:+ start:271 stop:852 length:582 start_codon:yes stop_codon:yes gene_type:complete
MPYYPSDLSLIKKVKKTRDEDSLLQLIERHSGIYHSMVNHFMSHPQNALDKNQMVDEKDSTIYSAALNYDPTKKTKFSTHLANQTKWKCLNLLNKNKRNREFFIDEADNNYEPSCESFLSDLKKEEAFSLFKKCLEREKDERVKKIIDIRYDTSDNKLTPWRKISKSLNMSIQGCINIHNRFLEKVKRHIKNV